MSWRGVDRKVMLRSIPARRELETERWMEEQEMRHHCPRREALPWLRGGCGIGLKAIQPNICRQIAWNRYDKTKTTEREITGLMA